MPNSYDVGDHFERFIEAQVEAGHYACASDVVRDALRLLEARERARSAGLDEVRAEIRKGLDSGPGTPADLVFERLQRKYATKG